MFDTMVLIKFKSISRELEILRITTDNMLVSTVKNNTFNLITSIKNNKDIEKSDNDKVVTGDSGVFDGTLSGATMLYGIVVMGDVDGNGIINLIDIMKVASHVYTDNKLDGYYK